MTVVAVEFVDYGVYGEYGFFGKVVVRSMVAGMTRDEIEAEKAEVRALVGEHVFAVEVEEVGWAVEVRGGVG